MAIGVEFLLKLMSPVLVAKAFVCNKLALFSKINFEPVTTSILLATVSVWVPKILTCAALETEMDLVARLAEETKFPVKTASLVISGVPLSQAEPFHVVVWACKKQDSKTNTKVERNLKDNTA